MALTTNTNVSTGADGGSSMALPHIPSTYWNGDPVHGPSTHPAGSVRREIGLAVDHYLPGSEVADKQLHLNEHIRYGSHDLGTPLDEIVVVSAYLALAYLAYRLVFA